MSTAPRMLRSADTRLAHLTGRRTAQAIRRLSANNIHITCYGRPLDAVHSRIVTGRPAGISGLPLKNKYFITKEIGKIIRKLATETGIKELHASGIKQIDVAFKFWSESIHKAFIQMYHGKVDNRSACTAALAKFFAFANRATTQEEKTFIIKLLYEVTGMHHAPTMAHLEGTRGRAIAIAREMGISMEKIELLDMAAILHDIGKLGMTPELLNKIGQLDPDDVARIRIHVDIGVDILKSISWIPKEVIDAVLFHHYYKKYPANINPEDAPLLARILAIADCLDKMTNDQTYRAGKMSYADAIKDFRSPKYPYDQEGVDALERVIKAEGLI